MRPSWSWRNGSLKSGNEDVNGEEEEEEEGRRCQEGRRPRSAKPATQKIKKWQCRAIKVGQEQVTVWSVTSVLIKVSKGLGQLSKISEIWIDPGQPHGKDASGYKRHCRIMERLLCSNLNVSDETCAAEGKEG